MKKILILSRYDNLAASARQRFQLYEDTLRDHGFILITKPLFSNSYLKRLFSRKRTNFFVIIYSYFKRLIIILTANKYDIVWLQYESFPYLPSFTERLLPLINKNIVTDYDDAIFHKYDDWGNIIIKKILGKKLDMVLSSSEHIICGNNYIEDWANKISAKTIIIPTVVSFDRYKIKLSKERSDVVLGWIGSPATWCYMEPYLDLFCDLSKKYNFKIMIIGSGIFFNDRNFIFREWNEETEISDLNCIDIGVMPLPDDKWANGKCGYKIIQYMATSTPVIASPVGINSKIISHGKNGFLANTPEEWRQYIITLVQNSKLRDSMGKTAQQTVQKSYSLESQSKKLVSLFTSISK